MYPLLISLELGVFKIIELEGIPLGFLLKFAILREYKPEFRYSNVENKKNIRLILQEPDFFILNSICKENNCYINEFAGDLILEAFLEIANNRK